MTQLLAGAGRKGIGKNAILLAVLLWPACSISTTMLYSHPLSVVVSGMPGGTEFTGDCHAGAVERKHVMGNGDAVGCHDPDERNACDRKPLLDSLLVEAHKQDQRDDQQSSDFIGFSGAGRSGSITLQR
jgi:hypothetical protein